MEEITNFTMKDFLRQHPVVIEEYVLLLSDLNPIPTKNEIEDLSVSKVEFIKQNLGVDESLIKVFEYVEDMDEEGFSNMKITTFFGLFNSIIKQIERIIQMENNLLVSKHTNTKWELVEGPKRLSKFGIIPLLDNLSGGDILKWDAILELPYATVFKKLYYDVVKGDVEQDMNKIKSKVE